jgi:hypothetical protein
VEGPECQPATLIAEYFVKEEDVANVHEFYTAQNYTYKPIYRVIYSKLHPNDIVVKAEKRDSLR